MRIFRSHRLDERMQGIEKLNKLKSNRNKTLVIHYSCESFFNLEGRTPRVTSICVKNRASGETKAFSIHLQAQFKKINLAVASVQDIDLLEKEMLSEFNSYVKKNSSYCWVHWNMRNASYGFEAIANRCRIVGGRTFTIEDDQKFDLPDILGKLYTYNFVDHQPSGQLFNMSHLNAISTKDALTGKEEAEAFENKDYLKLHMSTMRKVEMIDRILNLLEQDNTKIKSKKTEIYGLSFLGVIEIVRSSPLLLIIWSIIIFILGAAMEPVIQRFFGTS
ncbi:MULTISPECIES: hypothetical protein [Paenibacillus]|uniref:hypothetical protein n=1 Tax=Paenibacillus TaxID=44249 RepID=UPI0003D3907D|nr:MULTISPECIES: hypothetical protein [Paenibacillus]ALA43247.1 hypothetical protein ABE82_17715 [Paenibacillus peoriae]APB74966.1 hypothetical protein PPYC2_08280 [Paenibacillus polymyxa]POR27086.1 hypothetical protein CG775_14435 [Paenibacillus polymyxa]